MGLPMVQASEYGECSGSNGPVSEMLSGMTWEGLTLKHIESF